MFDYHMHSSFSTDSTMDIDEACEKAISMGFKEIAFTDHLDIDYPDPAFSFYIDFNEYEESLRYIKEKYKSRIKILTGIEVGLQPHVLEESNQIINSHDFDLVIASVHGIDKLDLYNGDFCRNKSKQEAYYRYFEETLMLLDVFDNFEILGHIDSIRRYGDYENKSLYYRDYSDIIDAILKKIISMGKGIELNTSSYKYNPASGAPDFKILQRYKELGGEIVTVGSDAHSLAYIGYKFDEIHEMLKRAGFKYLAAYEKRKARFEKIP